MDASYTLRTISDILHECQQLIFSITSNKSNYDLILASDANFRQRLTSIQANIAIIPPPGVLQAQLVSVSEKETSIIMAISRIKNSLQLLLSQSISPMTVVCAAYNCTSTLRQRNGTNLITLSGSDSYVLSTSGSGAGSLTFESSDSRIGVDTDFGSFLLNTVGFSFVNFEFSLYFESSDESILTGPSIGFGISLVTNTTPTVLQVSRCQPTRTLFNNNAPGFTGGGRCTYKIQPGITSVSARIFVTKSLFSAKLFYGCGYVPFFRVRMY